MEGVACRALVVGGAAAAEAAVGVWCVGVVCGVGAVVSGVCGVAADAVGGGAVAGGAFAAARACAAAKKSCELGGAAPHQVALVEAGGGAAAGTSFVAPVGGRGLAWVSADVIAVVGMVVVSCVVLAGGVGGPVCGDTPVGVAGAVVPFVPRRVCGGARGDGVARGAAGSRVGVAVAAEAGSVVSASLLGLSPEIIRSCAACW